MKGKGNNMGQERFDKNKVICVNLQTNTDSKLESISEIYSISYEAMLQMKKQGYVKVWMEKGGYYLIAYTKKKNPDMLMICKNFDKFATKHADFLRSMKQVPTPPSMRNLKKTEKEENNKQIVLETDAILEKIFQHGIDSITKEEKDFLDNLSK